MKYFPLKTALFCILFTPLLYTAILGGLESFLGPVYQQKVENRLIGDSSVLLDGTTRIQDAVGQNIHTLLRTDSYIRFFDLDVDILVTGKGGVVLFPLFEPPEIGDSVGRDTWDAAAIARQNYEILDKGLNVKVIVRIDHGTVGANLILGVLIVVSLLLFYLYYRRGTAKALSDDREKGRQIDRLMADEQAFKQTLSHLEQERRHLFESLKFLTVSRQEDQKKASITEDDMFEEIVSWRRNSRRTSSFNGKKSGRLPS